uniref:Putative ovule protein n=1 Tax=Solanum chacoense TaxID=4108 RepID=A0A0V0H8N1_SOLCH
MPLQLHTDHLSLNWREFLKNASQQPDQQMRFCINIQNVLSFAVRRCKTIYIIINIFILKMEDQVTVDK